MKIVIENTPSHLQPINWMFYFDLINFYDNYHSTNIKKILLSKQINNIFNWKIISEEHTVILVIGMIEIIRK